MFGTGDEQVAFCYLTTFGRRTGRPHTIEIWFGAAGGTLYLLAGARERADWVRNLRTTPAVEVVLAGRNYSARARVLEPGTEEDGLARRLLLAKYQAPGAHDLERWGERALAVAVDVSAEEPAHHDVGTDARDLELGADHLEPGAGVEVDGGEPGVGPQLAAPLGDDVVDARREEGGADSPPSR